jgi:hypothetical protein
MSMRFTSVEKACEFLFLKDLRQYIPEMYVDIQNYQLLSIFNFLSFGQFSALISSKMLRISTNRFHFCYMGK